MKNQTIVLEVSHKFIKVVIGQVIDGMVSIVYAKKVPINHLLENGMIKDKATLVSELSKLNPLLDSEYHINQMLDDIVLVLPPYGLEIYQTQQITSVISPEKVVGNLDIKNIYSIIKNKKLPNENELINIYINNFTIDSGEKFLEAPIGMSTGAISADAKVHTLPRRVNDEYSNVMLKAGIKIGQKIVSTYGAVELLKTDKNLPKNYYLVDIGANSTSLSLIGNSDLLATRSFSWGGDVLTEKLILKYNISEATAENVKKLFGIDNRKTTFKYPVIKTDDEEKREYYQDDLNQTITQEFNQFTESLLSSMDQLNKLYSVAGDLPIILIGGASRLNGLVNLLKIRLGNSNISLATPKVIGARDPSMFAVLGAIIVYNKYLADLDSNSAVNVFREE